MEWRFAMSGAPVLQGGKFGNPICIKSADGTPSHINQLPVGQSYKTLGAHIEPMQHQKTHFNTLLAKAKLHSRLLASSSYQAPHTWIYYYSVYLQSIGYSLPVSHLSFAQLNKLQQPIVPIVLSKMGYCSNTSRILTFLCSFYGGIDFRDLRLEQGIGQITFLIRHLRTPGQVCDLLAIVLSWFQFCAGVGYPVFLQPERPLPHLEGHWLVCIRNFLAHIDGALEMTKTHIQPLQHMSDSFLMDTACNSGLFTPAELKRLNYCRLYLNVLTLSNVTDAKGNRFAPSILDSIQSVQQSSSKGPSAKQERPSNETWALWRRLLHIFGNKYQLFLPLGPWISSGPELRRDWPTLFSPEYRKIYRLTNRKYEVCSQVRHCVHSFLPDDTQVEVLDVAIPVDASKVSDGWRVMPPSPTLYPEECVNFPATFQDYVDLLPNYDAMLIQRVDFLGIDVYETYESLLSSDSLLLVSDGGANDSRGSTGWIVPDDTGRRLIRGSGSVPGLDPRANVTASVDWDGFAAAYKSNFRQIKFVFKFCTKLLPTGKTLHRCESRFDDRCPAGYSLPQESNDHLFQCPDISRQRWRSSTTSSLRQRLKNNATNLVLLDIMMAGLDSYFQAKPFDYSDFTEFDNSTHPRHPYYSLIGHQEAIGWDHFLHGKLSHHWTLLQQDFVWRTNPTKKFDSEAWLRLIIRPTFTTCQDLWTTSNDKRHGKDSKTKKSLHAAQAERDLRALYAASENTSRLVCS
jgi:hypothetical protein